MSNIVLFDMDGTLTPARKKISKRMVNAIIDLLKYTEVGIVTGSGLDYLKEQCSDLWNDSRFLSSGDNLWDIILLPCNGTQLLNWNGESWSLSYDVSMREKLGNESMDRLFQGISHLQAKYIDDYFGISPLTGHFISSRGSLINWCPIGRNANDNDRENFIKLDEDHRVRLRMMDQLISYMSSYNIENVIITLGGSTSLDIYPDGWDKTYALNHFPDDIIPWFVGDKCKGTGNDRSIYEKLLKSGNSFETSGPNETIKIIRDKIIPNIIE
jgi:phosphomannomutase